MLFSDLFAVASQEEFLREHFLRLPYSLCRAASRFRPLATWETVKSLLSRSDVDALAVREGQRWSAGRAPAHDETRSLHSEGYTILVRHAERHNEGLRGLAASFEAELRAPVDVHVYCTPADRFGFGWRYHAEDVFILQTEGTKEYRLRKNTVNPWPLFETLPLDMKYEREQMPMMECRLEAGDWLYLPHGYWHAARGVSDSISIAVEVLMPAGIDVLDFARQRLLDSIRWRQRLPLLRCGGDDRDAVERCRSAFVELASDLAWFLNDEAFVRAYLASREPPEQ